MIESILQMNVIFASKVSSGQGGMWNFLSGVYASTVGRGFQCEKLCLDINVIAGDDWHTAQTQPDSEFHIMPSVGVQLAFFSAVKSDYKQLPQ